ncbi:stage II sporulation protein M [Microbacterium sp.]|uniref:stage II sporulation protein M n=1 Tax=Microbacterium sp. TaxID=51671 RepID=UPI002616C362|nr:stage II sporulation protein M [Microbacterium sp.]
MTVALWAVTLALGTAAQLPFDVTPQDDSYHPWDQVPIIFVNNLAVGVTIYAGVISFGAIAVAMTILSGIYIGSVIGLAVSAWGVAGAFEAFWPFLLLEILGFMFFTFAGLLPVFRARLAFRANTAARVRSTSRIVDILYRTAAQIAASLPFAIFAAVLLAVGAVLEVAGGLPR